MAENTGQPAPAAPEPTSTPAPQPAAPAPAAAPASPPAAKDKASTTLAGKGAAPEKAGDWPDDWRNRMAGDDAKKLKRLERFKSPADVLEFGLSAEKSWKQGKDADPFPAEGTDEEKTAWRKAQGLPEKPDGYAMPEGLVVGDADKPLVGKFLEAMHAKNVAPDVVQTALTSYYAIQDEIAAERADQDAQDQYASFEALKGEWGADYQRYMGAAMSLFDGAPEGIRDLFLGARLADGTALGNHAAAIKWLAHVSSELNPAATVVPAGGGDSLKTIEGEIATMQKLMADRKSEYYSGPKAEGHQSRYRELIAARDKIRQRSAA